MKQFAVLLLLVLLGCSEPLDREILSEDEAVAEYAELVADYVEQNNIAGVATAIVRADEIIFMQGFGFRDVAAQLPVTDETLFHIGSVNKSFTALLVATLVDEELIGWDQPVREIYPDFALATRDATENVTIRHLLTMRSGIPDWAEDEFDIDRATAQDVFPFVASADLIAAPGEQFSYSNLSSSMAGYLAVIAATGNDDALYAGYADLLTARILHPIGMTDARVRVSELYDNPNYGYSYILEGGTLVEAEPEDYDGDPLAPSGTLKANVHEMARYVQTQLNAGVSPSGERIVTAATINETWQPYLENYAMGWEINEIDGITIIQHEGAYDNYLSIAGFLPDEGLGFVVLTNTADAAEALIETVPEAIVQLFLD